MSQPNKQKTLYRRSESPYWYYDTQDPVTGRRVRKSTRETDYKKAMQKYKESLCTGGRVYAAPSSSLAHLLKLYTDPDTNPRRKQRVLDGYRYGYEHACHIASFAKEIIRILEKSEEKNLLRKKLSALTKLDIRVIRDTIVLDRGRCRSAQQMFTAFKTFLSQAELDGIIQFDPGDKVPNIIYEVHHRSAIEASELAKIIARPEIFPCVEDWVYFTVLATTGMRKSEVLAISQEQIFKGKLTIDRALKSNDPDDLGKPKCDVIRVIPLSSTTLKALSCLYPDGQGRYFHHGRCWGDLAFKRCRDAVIGAYPEERAIWEQMTAHVLRHSINTNLLYEGANPTLVAEYLGWQHQELLDIQRRYTHPLIYKLDEIARKIDELYGKQAAEAKRNTLP